MAVLRLFAQAREAAGAGRAVLPGTTVAEVLAAACASYGTAFEEVLTVSRVWLNGDPVDRNAPVEDSDEVAVLPPVSGGMDSVGGSHR